MSIDLVFRTSGGFQPQLLSGAAAEDHLPPRRQQRAAPREPPAAPGARLREGPAKMG